MRITKLDIQQLIAGLLLLVILMSPYAVYAVTTNLAVIGEGAISGSYGTETYVGGAADYTVLNSDDSDTSYLKTESEFPYSFSHIIDKYHTWQFTNFPYSSINSVTLYLKAKDSGGVATGIIVPLVTIGGTNYYGSASGLTSSYATYSKTWNVSPSTGLAWSQTELNNARFGSRLSYSNLSAAEEIRLTYAYIVVDYTLSTPTVTTTTPVTTIGVNTTTLAGTVTGTGGVTPDWVGFVYGTTSNTTNPLNRVPPAGYTSNTTGAYSASFTGSLTGLTAGTTYYGRAYAHNSVGYGYGDEVSWKTVGTPYITTNSATNVANTVAQLNATVSDDGEQACDVRFGYGLVSQAATDVGFAAYTNHTSWVTNTYETGDKPYASISGLVAATTYYYNVQIENDAGHTYGIQGTFTTESGVSEPTSLKGIPTSNTISLSWVKGSGSANTIIRYKVGTYPTGTGDGASAYSGTQTSTVVSGLASGRTYYFIAWGYTSPLYSTSNTTLMITTLASASTTSTLDTPATPTTWFQSPNYTNMSEMPFYPILNFAFKSFELPLATGWYFAALFFSVAVGILFYTSLGNSNLFLSVCVVGVTIVFMAIIQLVPLWHILPFAIFAITGIIVGERR
jgi:hypothetical protein